MTKVNEDDLQFDPEDENDDESTTSQGYKNYITPDGMQKLKSEYHKLFHEERPKLVEVISWAASNGDRSENGDYIYGKKRLREIDRRLRFLGKRMAQAVVVEKQAKPPDQVLFGVRVTVEDENSKKLTYDIIGEDEIDLENRKISWVSPLAKAIMGKRVGDQAMVQRPQGELELTIIKIEYPK